MATEQKGKKKKKEPSPNAKPHHFVKDVKPLRDPAQIEGMMWALKRHCTMRDYIAFIMGVNTGLRAGDMMKRTVAEVKGKRRIKVQEGKTDKTRDIYLAPIYEELQKYIESLPPGTVWLFPSRKGDKPMTVTHFWRQLKIAADWAGVDAVGSHTCRKTFAYWHYKQYKNVAQLQDILNHDKPGTTLLYIGITDEEIEESIMNLSIGGVKF